MRGGTRGGRRGGRRGGKTGGKRGGRRGRRGGRRGKRGEKRERGRDDREKESGRGREGMEETNSGVQVNNIERRHRREEREDTR